ncbi:MAG: NUDIX pyrophosphatase [Nanoarchaeota archaeon]|nr:NUDIX pyrophosphatase [Nanoarchaeota archaeon]
MGLNIQVLCILFRKAVRHHEFLLLKRVPDKGGFWQPVGGGVEDTDGSLLDAAYREILEETGIARGDISRVIDDVHYFEFDRHYLTGEPIDKIKEYVLGFEVKGSVSVKLEDNPCGEHEDFRWVSFEDSYVMLKWQNNKDGFMKLRQILDSEDGNHNL